MRAPEALLRHYLAALAYRTQKALRGAPDGFGAFRVAPGVRTPAEIVRHMTSVLGYARTHFVGGTYRPEPLPDLAQEVVRFHAMLQDLAGHLERGEALRGTTPERLVQGPLADAMTHAGQLALLRRLAGSPVPSENFIMAAIDPANLGPDQPPPVSPEPDWPLPLSGEHLAGAPREADISCGIEPVEPDDWPAMRAIYAEGIATGHATFEAEAPDWGAWDSAHLPRPRLVARADRTVVGWAAISPVSSRCVYGGVAEVSLYVGAACRGRGVGSRLLSALVEAAEAAGLWTLQAGIFPENAASLSLFHRHGFREVGRRERLGLMTFGPLAGAWRDVVLLERRSRSVGTAPATATTPAGAGEARTCRLYVVVEQFKGGDPVPVYRRFREQGRMAPEGLVYLASWVSLERARCYQLMETHDPALIDEWTAHWCDIVEFEVVTVVTSAKAAGTIAPRLDTPGREPG